MKAPFIHKRDIEREAAHLISSYEGKYGVNSVATPVDSIAEHYLGLTVDVLEMEGDILGCIDIHNKAISINQSLDPFNNENMVGRYNFTLAHEVGHFLLHKELVRPVMPNLFGEGIIEQPKNILCRTSEYKEDIEWQADYFAAALLMPINRIKEQWALFMGNTEPHYYVITESSIGYNEMVCFLP